MTQDDAFLASIIENPNDEALRLIYADWLEEREDSRGQFIKIMCELAHLRKSDRRRAGLEDQARELLTGQRDAWLVALLPLLDSLPWLKHVGQPTHRDAEVCRIKGWQDWPGPEDRLVNAWYNSFQQCSDRVLNQAGPLREEMNGLLESIRSAVLSRAKLNVALYDPDQDAWHGPSLCVWDVSYRAGLFTVHLLANQSMPAEQTQAWSWVVAGHWPCRYARRPRPSRGRLLMVY